MADKNYLSHTSLDGRTFVARAAEQGVGVSSENIAAGSASPQAVLDLWAGSEHGHCENMLDPSYTVVGIGHGFASSSDYKDYWTQMFHTDDATIDESCHPAFDAPVSDAGSVLSVAQAASGQTSIAVEVPLPAPALGNSSTVL